MTEQAEKSTETPETEEQNAEVSVRDAVAAAAAEMADTEQPAEAPEGEEAPVEAAEDVPEAPEPVEVPDWWDQGQSGVWENLPREAQDLLVAHEQKRTEAIASEAVPEPVRGALRQIEDHAKMYGLSADQALLRLYQAQRLLESNPRHALAQLASEYGVDLAQFAAAPDGSGTVQQEPDPLDAVRQVVQQELGGFRQEMSEQQVRSSLQELENWSKETDADGNLLRPDFEANQHLVKAEMDRILTTAPSKDPWQALDEAYKAVSAPKVQDVDALVAAKVAEALKAQDAEAQRAQKAAVSPRPGASGTASQAINSSGSVRDDVIAAAAEMAAGSRI